MWKKFGYDGYYINAGMEVWYWFENKEKQLLRKWTRNLYLLRGEERHMSKTPSLTLTCDSYSLQFIAQKVNWKMKSFLKYRNLTVLSFDLELIP